MPQKERIVVILSIKYVVKLVFFNFKKFHLKFEWNYRSQCEKNEMEFGKENELKQNLQYLFDFEMNLNTRSNVSKMQHFLNEMR